MKQEMKILKDFGQIEISSDNDFYICNIAKIEIGNRIYFAEIHICNAGIFEQEKLEYDLMEKEYINLENFINHLTEQFKKESN